MITKDKSKAFIFFKLENVILIKSEYNLLRLKFIIKT